MQNPYRSHGQQLLDEERTRWVDWVCIIFVMLVCMQVLIWIGHELYVGEEFVFSCLKAIFRLLENFL